MTGCREALFGGAMRGGKSIAGLMGAAQDVDVPQYKALILRRTFKELSQPGGLMSEAKEWWSGKAKWNGDDYSWTFPAGSIIKFGHCENDGDELKYKGGEYQYIFFDELTDFMQDQYRFMFTRNTRKQGMTVPIRMRGGTNPGGRGAAWVKKRFGLQGKVMTPVMTEDRIFIPSRLSDNPSVDVEAYLLSLGELDPISRAQFLEGDWEAFRGGRFKPSWLQYYQKRGGAWHFGKRNFTDQQIGQRFLTVDPAATVERGEAHDPDWTAISAWGVNPDGQLVWLGVWRDRIEIPDIPKNVGMMYQRFRARKVYCEGFGIGQGPPQLIARYKLPGGGFMSTVTYSTVGKNKLSVASEALNMAEAGRIWLPMDDPSFEEAEAEVLRFTGDARHDGHDDVVDTLSRAAIVMGTRDAQRSRTGGVVTLGRV